ncbi:pyridoxal phosphate-dependent aminotransferase [Rhodobacteraceae bacterium HSP-20]|uniref:aspartate transaminase n=1 Tax=Paragemmobacter amnigenus TaxID=2852097 RepID=A0ABS6J1D7_9RHOB|nr:pyridoxal phosphate-dependent aminotransferase [Rhodobacter amnigenus]MBU9697569.1 pyridoxal phosphate-dependent aminotransferase [Rhodobacter amnigenus]MBV4388796.1 pyridoxal phosphate-dependent aminotransferase [Rhodobacter amnigenus]
MRYAPVTERLAGLGGDKWHIHMLARRMAAAGEAVIELTIGEPDVPTPPALMDTAAAAMRAGRTGYSNGRGEPNLTAALAARYTARRGRPVTRDQVMCFPGTQTTLYAVLQAIVTTGDEVLVGDPMYATYEGLIRATGADVVPVPLRPGAGFRMQPADVAARITPRTRLLFLNSPHNPTGAVLSRDDLAALCALARDHDLWVLCDEVYEDLCFPGTTFASPLDLPDFADRVIVASSISKSHAAPGFRSGWCVGPAEFCARLLPLSETMLFGSQPFIADMTAEAVSAPSPVAADMMARFQRRAALIRDRLHGVAGLCVHMPQAGMFALLDIRCTGLSGDDFARLLLEREKVATMPGESFGSALAGWLRLSLTQPDDRIATACDRIATFTETQRKAA